MEFVGCRVLGGFIVEFGFPGEGPALQYRSQLCSDAGSEYKELVLQYVSAVHVLRATISADRASAR